jgi:DNA-binding response OmpR family regulator
MMTSQLSQTGTLNSILIFMKSEPFAQSLKKVFETNGYRTTIVSTETAAFAEAKSSIPSLILIDRQQGTVTNLRQFRTLSAVPIVAVEDGATPCVNNDDCWQEYEHDIDLVVCNPSPRELLARVRAILRRRQPRVESNTHISVGTIRMDLDRHEVVVAGRVVELTPKEFQILHQFMSTPGRVFSRQEMLNSVWGEGYALEEHALDVHIHSLRQKIESDPASPKMIMTVRGIGYKLRE